MKLLTKARKLDPNLFKDSTSIHVTYLDSFVVKERDSVIVKEKINVIGRTEVICDTIEGKARPFYQEVNTGLVKVRMWIDSTGKFYYALDQDSVVARFKELESQQKNFRDSIETRYVEIPRIEYRFSFKNGLISVVIGAVIGFGLLWLITWKRKA